MKWNLEKKLTAVGLGAALLVMGIISLISYHNAIQLIRSTERIKRNYSNLENLTAIQAILNEAESSRRGYLLFGTNFELERYNFAIAKLGNNLDTLEANLGSQPAQSQHFQKLRSLIEQRQRLLQTANILFLFNPNFLSTNHPVVIASRETRENLRQLLITMKAEEENALEIWIARSSDYMQYRLMIESVGTLISFTIFLSIYCILYKQLLKRQEAERIQQKLTQEKELSELKLEFLALISHEFRTPLSVILGSAQLLRETLPKQVERSRLRSLTRIESSAKAMKQMFADILTLARADAGKLEYQPKWVELQSFCLNLVEDMQISDQQEHVINLSDIGNRTHGWFDEAMIYSALSNLLSNALKYSPEGSHIDFILDGKVDMITFQVKDEGIGISPEDHLTLFEPFSRGTNVKNIVGTGLGLSLVKHCLDLHQGQVTVDSQVGRGSIFTVQIPQPR
ncbi:sensor histidine kinase [Pseudanabaena mucicola]|uniref:histidine kinase n=1 Tax=Pseudanabaena mucicola FACHB-723 TaxID=2692860 RepID=A0ABR7ZYG2_9CYAN|nr:ATP-binding protein [Pseudanabaena mucicola]MBD2188902.1 CHASE3 domain-containing protein [Pseudanabaena mucicola FACHB-723]